MHQSVTSSVYMSWCTSGMCSSCGKSLRAVLNSVGDRIDPC